MRPSFQPRLVNNPFDDPVLFIPFLYENRAILFDLGDIHALSARDILKTTHVFVTHTHMDHFIGFDRLLRLCLGREKTLHLFGPEGFLKNVEGKLAGYRWNLVADYRNRFILNVTEVRKDCLATKQYRCGNKFLNENRSQKTEFNGILAKASAFSVSAVILDHRIPCLGFSIAERFHINIKKEAVVSLGLDIGPWLREFKQALFSKKDPESDFDVKFGPNRELQKRYRLTDLTRHIAIISRGQKVTYITDVRYTDSEFRKIRDFAKNSDQLFIEAAFLEKDDPIARTKYHLTARQAGTIAGSARAKQITPFHFSPRYSGQAHLLHNETMAAYEMALKE
jgi:ribonuclease Z